MATGRKAAIVTGAASGLGRAMALGLVESGMDVVAVDRNATALQALAPAKSASGSVLPVPVDLTSLTRSTGSWRPRWRNLTESTC